MLKTDLDTCPILECKKGEKCTTAFYPEKDVNLTIAKIINTHANSQELLKRVNRMITLDQNDPCQCCAYTTKTSVNVVIANETTENETEQVNEIASLIVRFKIDLLAIEINYQIVNKTLSIQNHQDVITACNKLLTSIQEHPNQEALSLFLQKYHKDNDVPTTKIEEELVTAVTQSNDINLEYLQNFILKEILEDEQLMAYLNMLRLQQLGSHF